MSADEPGPATTARMPSAQRRDQLLDVAEGLFVTRGYSATSMEDVARGAGVTRPVPYRHFGTKEGVYLAVLERARREYEAVMIAAIDPELPAREQLVRVGDAFYSVLEDSPGRWKLLFASIAVLPVEFEETLAAQRFETIEMIRGLLAQLARPDIPPARITAAAHAMSGVAEPSLTRGEVVEHYADFLWGGLGGYARA